MNRKLLFNPFSRYSEKTLFTAGILSFAIGTCWAYFMGNVFDGVFDIHAHSVSFSKNICYHALVIALLSILLMSVAFIINRRTRLIDVVNGVLIARIPFYLPLIFLSIPALKNIENQLAESPADIAALSSGEMALLLFTSMGSLLFLVWSVIVLVNGFKIACNAKKATDYFLFTGAILIAEGLSKYLFLTLIF